MSRAAEGQAISIRSSLGEGREYKAMISLGAPRLQGGVGITKITAGFFFFGNGSEQWTN